MKITQYQIKQENINKSKKEKEIEMKKFLIYKQLEHQEKEFKLNETIKKDQKYRKITRKII